MKRTLIGSFVVISLLAIGLVARPAEARRGVRIKQNLAVTGVDTDARGQVQVMIVQSMKGMRGTLVVKAARLDRNTTFEVDLEGVRIGTLTTNGGGNGKAVFNTQPHGHDQLLGVDPRGKTVELRDASGNNVLQTKVPDDTIDPSQIRCCLAHGDEQAECESETADQCTAAGGVDMGAGSCMPNPCDTTTPPPPTDNIVCCKPDDSGPECDQSSATECSRENGINLGAGSCDPNPCTATTPENPETIQCCLTGGDSGESEVECEDRTPDLCMAQGGTNMGVGTCNPNPCSQTPAGDQIRCCVSGDSGNAECEQRTADECMAQGGMNVGAGSCDDHPCGTSPAPTPQSDDIRCCVTKDSDGTECEQRTADECTAHGGMNLGAGSCDPNPCG